mgnify:CR=1 FL=1
MRVGGSATSPPRQRPTRSASTHPPETDPAYSAQADALNAADITARNARAKAEQSAAESASKGAAYRGSRLFMYLWKRGYGTPDYAAMPLIRYLDGKVADLVGYDTARVDFGRLNEIPLRLGEHARRLEAIASEEDAALEALWTSARATEGLEPLDAALAEAEGALAAVDEETTATHARRDDLQDQLSALTAGEDDDTTFP